MTKIKVQTRFSAWKVTEFTKWYKISIMHANVLEKNARGRGCIRSLRKRRFVQSWQLKNCSSKFVCLSSKIIFKVYKKLFLIKGSVWHATNKYLSCILSKAKDHLEVGYYKQQGISKFRVMSRLWQTYCESSNIFRWPD